MGRGRGGGSGAVRGGGRGRGRGPGRMGGPQAAGPGGTCVRPNPNCGYHEPHQAGVLCYQKKCQKCGTQMIRES